VPATVGELKAALPKADDSLILDCLSRKLTVEQAKDEFIADQATRLEDQQAALAKAKAAAKRPGVEPLHEAGGNSAGGGDAIEQWNVLVAEELTRTKDRAKAIAAVVRENPELHQEYIAAYNARPRSQRRAG
jgi:hypothetical protein